VTHIRPRRAGRTNGRPPSRAILIGAAAVILTLTACTAPLPEVTFYGNRTDVTTEPTRWCAVDATAQQVTCTAANSDQLQRLSLRPGQPVQINVPGEVGEQPWGAYFRFRNAEGQLRDGRSEIFTDGRLAYTLHPFDDDDQLVYVEVQSGFVLMAGTDTSNVDFAASQSWLLLIDPIEPSSSWSR
jgi:hypothetical protein